MRRTLGLLSLSLSIACGGAQRAPEGKAAQQAARSTGEAARWDALSDRYLERTFVFDPGFAVYQGRHERDGEIIDFSEASVAARASELMQFRKEAEAIPDGALDEARRFERSYLLANVDAGLFSLTRLKDHERSPFVYANAIDPSIYLTRPYAPLSQRLAAYIKHARNIPWLVATMKANLHTPLPRTFVDVGLIVFGGLGPYVERDVPPIFAAVEDSALQRELAEATKLAKEALADATRWLEAQKPTATENFALGPELFREMLWANERVDTPLEVLRAEGQRDLARNLEAMRKACSALGMPALSACAERINSEKPEGGPVVAARAQLTTLRKRLVETELVSIPSEQLAGVDEAPPYKRWNQAYIEIPGPYEQSVPATYYIAPPDPKWSLAERTAYVPGELDLMFISVHEVWPGHFLQFLHANRAPRKFGRVFVGYAFAEGWAHYAEELALQEGVVEKEPKAEVAQLLNALLRNVRFLSALGLHTEGMSVAESERLFRESALSDPANARQQAARGTFDPGYLNYTLGKLIIRKLRDDWVKSRGGRAAYRAFHDKLLSYGGPPLPLLRAALLGDGENAL